ncbi:sarcosine oxidase [Hyphomicrobium nitrativorans NL23]|uniref:Sarcosine oxidase n=1 Tax=Hyphomicrobium nitrativorans NL23 TaxID=1029756 RepID=V5SEB0_9HYPH|nr:sarcosine oxidase [Hyphomicrobium nitrativorans]AHB48853.1 sarcosine oxidase [Hyphomicrobium nitrativorans NL23]
MSDTAASPPLTRARTPLAHILAERGAHWRTLGDTAAATKLSTSPALDELAIVDLSPLPRIGFKGRGTIEAMRARGLLVEAEPNRLFPQDDGSLCLVLAPSEVLILSAFDGNESRFSEWEQTFRLDDEECTYPLPRRDSHAWLAVTGRRAPAMFAKLCGVDLRLGKFPNHAIAQTSVARINAIVARSDRGETPVFHLLADIASALYLSSCLLDAAREYGGEFAGLDRLESLT